MFPSHQLTDGICSSLFARNTGSAQYTPVVGCKNLLYPKHLAGYTLCLVVTTARLATDIKTPSNAINWKNHIARSCKQLWNSPFGPFALSTVCRLVGSSRSISRFYGEPV